MRPSRLTPGTPWDIFSVFADDATVLLIGILTQTEVYNAN